MSPDKTRQEPPSSHYPTGAEMVREQTVAIPKNCSVAVATNNMLFAVSVFKFEIALRKIEIVFRRLLLF